MEAFEGREKERERERLVFEWFPEFAGFHSVPLSFFSDGYVSACAHSDNTDAYTLNIEARKAVAFGAQVAAFKANYANVPRRRRRSRKSLSSRLNPDRGEESSTAGRDSSQRVGEKFNLSTL